MRLKGARGHVGGKGEGNVSLHGETVWRTSGTEVCISQSNMLQGSKGSHVEHHQGLDWRRGIDLKEFKGQLGAGKERSGVLQLEDD
ncbi:hypothetical protein GOP47_0002828 [Adiantum capillus-veneris]|uniref:Uncharacterized protein n=1 Tax=Adiantum capillus-veneris TaxID=13818 RepID=A0A9D4VAT7_ADICA|nr:hypothetical protein GOP47_0002828 [Adiantum capillus-veneris]